MSSEKPIKQKQKQQYNIKFLQTTKTFKIMKITTNPIVGGGYEAPEIEVVTTVVERGFEGSLNFGEEGAAGALIDGESYDL